MLDKRKIRKMKRPQVVPSELVILTRERIKNEKYSINNASAITAETVDDILVLHVFHIADKGGRSYYLNSIYMDKEDFITLEDNKWKKGKANRNLEWCEWCYSYATNDTIETVKGYLENLGFEYKENCSVLRNIEFHQDRIAQKRNVIKYAKEKASYDSAMAPIKPAKKCFINFMKKDLWKDSQFMMYDSKEHTGYCTWCNSVSPMKTGKQNDMVKCPSCGNTVKVKSIRKGNTDRTMLRNAVIIEKYGDYDTIIRYFNVTRSINDYKNHTYTCREVVRTIIGNVVYENYEIRPFHNTGITCWCKVNGEPIHSFNDSRLYVKNLKSNLRGTWAEYSGLELFEKAIKKDLIKARENLFGNYRPNGWKYEMYLYTYKQTPAVEYLLKEKMYELASWLYANRFHLEDTEIQPGKTLSQMLGISKLGFKVLKEIGNPSPDILKCVRSVSCWKDPQKIKEFVAKDSLFKNRRETAIDLLENSTTMHKLTKYLAAVEDPVTYFDYIEACKDLGYDMRNEMILFPKNLQEAHDIETANAEKGMQKEHIAMANMFLPKQHELYDFEDNNFIIKAPDDAGEIITEGHMLHHCVARYVKTVAAGKTTILFVRRKEAVDKPFVTVEVRDGRVAQCYGHNDTKPEKEVMDFVDKFKHAKGVA